MNRGPIPLNAHAALEPVIGVILIAAPWIFGFSDVSEATTVSVVLGVVAILSGLSTRWRFSVVKLIPLRVHFAMDLVIGLVLIVSPFVLGFDDDGGATRFAVIAGALEILAALATRWDPRQADVRSRHGGGAHAAAR